jgi:hypothetical protein
MKKCTIVANQPVFSAGSTYQNVSCPKRMKAQVLAHSVLTHGIVSMPNVLTEFVMFHYFVLLQSRFFEPGLW